VLSADIFPNCFSGLSGKSQIMFAIVFTSRYLDLFTTFISVYNSVMKVIFLLSSYATLYLLYAKFKATYDTNHDAFRVEFLVTPMAGLAVLVNHEFTFLEVIARLWRKSIPYDSDCLSRGSHFFYCNCNQTCVKCHSVTRRHSQPKSVTYKIVTKQMYFRRYQNRGREKVRGSE